MDPFEGSGSSAEAFKSKIDKPQDGRIIVESNNTAKKANELGNTELRNSQREAQDIDTSGVDPDFFGSGVETEKLSFTPKIDSIGSKINKDASSDVKFPNNLGNSKNSTINANGKGFSLNNGSLKNN